MNQRMISVTILGKTREYPYGTFFLCQYQISHCPGYERRKTL